MIAYLIMAASGGAQFGAHFSDVWIKERFAHGWAQMFAHMVGIIVNAPFFHMLLTEFDIPKKYRRLIMLLYFASFFSGGLGTLIGWIIRPTPNHNGGNGK